MSSKTFGIIFTVAVIGIIAMWFAVGVFVYNVAKVASKAMENTTINYQVKECAKVVVDGGQEREICREVEVK